MRMVMFFLGSLLLLSACDDLTPASPGPGTSPTIPASLEDWMTSSGQDVDIAPTDAVLDADSSDLETAELGDAPTELDIVGEEVAPGAPLIERVDLVPESPVPLSADVTLTVVASDPDGDPLTYSWSLEPGSWQLAPGATTDTDTTILTAPGETGEEARVRVVVSDPGGLTASTTVRPVTVGVRCAEGTAHCEGSLDTCESTTSGRSESCAAHSCLEALVTEQTNDGRDGLYWLDASGTPTETPCDMTTGGGGWTPIVVLDPAAGCPGGWVANTDPPVCRRGDATEGSVVEASFPSPGLRWRQVFGHLRALHYSSMDAFHGGSPALDTIYIDGASLTVGAPRQHLWSLGMARYNEPDEVTSGGGIADLCPCTGGPPAPAYVAGHYTCESAPDPGGWSTGDEMWHGDGFWPNCEVYGDPADFERTLDAPTEDPIDIRLMANQSTGNENIGVLKLDLRVREMESCDETGEDDDYDGLVDEVGCGPTNPAASCLDIQSSAGWAGDGVYWILPRQGAEPQRVYCDMTTDGGGWSLAAVCRAHDAQSVCRSTDALGDVTSPKNARSGKLADDDIRALLTSGQGTTRGFWRQKLRRGVVDPVSAVVYNRFANEYEWASDTCGTPGRNFQVKVAHRAGIDFEMAVLSADAWSQTYADVTTAEGGCACAANGWSNALGDGCQDGAAWANCKDAPSMAPNCAELVVDRGEVVLWVR